MPGRLTPLLQDQLAHLGTWMPFAKAAAFFTRFTHTLISESTVQRHTQAVGLAYQAVQRAAVEQIERDCPDIPPGPAKLVVSADGAMVPLVGGEWAEVKTVVVSEVRAVPNLEEQATVRLTAHSYFSRLSDAETFERDSIAELMRRRVATAGQVAAVNDGAEWIQRFFDYHRPDALRILDFPHAAERVSQIGNVVLGEASVAAKLWRTTQLHELKHDGPGQVLVTLQMLAAEHPTVALLGVNLAYLEKRVAQMQYPSFQAQGWPIGSGVVESSNKLVVEARLKGAGMHWARASVNPMLCLRNAVCNDRWDEAWQQSSVQLRCVGAMRRPTQPKTTPNPEPMPVLTPAAVREPPVPVKSAASHFWRRTNYATKARLAQLRTDAKL